jgi:hypothetical protein
MGCRVLARGVSSFTIACRRYDTMEAGLAGTVVEHVGTHGAFLLKIGYECAVQLDQFAVQLARAYRFRQPLNVVAYCIGGEKWSVALATVLYHCVKGLKGVNPFDPAFPQHLCSSEWHRTCRGVCNECQNALHSDVIELNPGLALAVERFNRSFQYQIAQRYD